ncbi:hypothetical protein NUW58_g7360 [Xylaria curta]|uniref:Uncharacterized protein n=1 Tax=Xylaria curta TaxID=42375 RepID=A0ACC1NIT9_9PEZI|nr:hypothetical protein NUW58_g7360 [Xylaria curta]
MRRRAHGRQGRQDDSHDKNDNCEQDSATNEGFGFMYTAYVVGGIGKWARAYCRAMWIVYGSLQHPHGGGGLAAKTSPVDGLGVTKPLSLPVFVYDHKREHCYVAEEAKRQISSIEDKIRAKSTPSSPETGRPPTWSGRLDS